MKVLKLTVKTNQPETRIISETESEIKLAVHAPPTEGKANQEIIKFLAKHFKANIQIIRGKTSKTKVIKIGDQ